MEGTYEKIIITIVPSYTGKKKSTRLLPLALLLVLHTHNNSDSNKLVIFSGIALYYGDTYILSITCAASALILHVSTYSREHLNSHLCNKCFC